MSSGEFFAIDRRAWEHACSLGLNPPVVYLLLARGTGADQRTSSWSIHAVERYTGLSRPRAQSALAELVRAGLVRILKPGTRPVYYFNPANQIPEPFSREERSVLDNLAAGARWIPKTASFNSEWKQSRPFLIALALASRGHLRDLGSQRFELAPDGGETRQPDWIWLPNALVSGADDEVPPLERVRRLQDVRVLRLLVSLYHDQNLPSDGGLNWRVIRRSFKREKIGEVGRWNVWQFREDDDIASWRGAFAAFQTGDHDKGSRDLWESWRLLNRAGLIECVPHLVEAETEEAEIMHPCSRGTGTELERDLGDAVQEAAFALLGDEKVEWIKGDGPVAPVPDEFPNVQMMGIYRLRYRPKTRATGAWFARQAELKEYIGGYLSLAREAGAGEAITFPTNLQHQGRSKGVIKGDKRV